MIVIYDRNTFIIQATGQARGQHLEQKSMLSSSFRRDQIYERCDFGHTLLCYLSQTWKINIPYLDMFLVLTVLKDNSELTPCLWPVLLKYVTIVSDDRK
jgi:hypothetical protein